MMAVSIGHYDGCPILRHEIRRFGSSEAVAVTVSVTDAYGETQEGVCRIWLTERAMRMARAQLKACGFDPDKGHLWDLQDNHELLKGNRVSVSVEEYSNYGLQFSIALGAVTKKSADSLTKKLRAVASDARSDVAAPPADDGPAPWDEDSEPPKARRDINEQNARETAEAKKHDDGIPF